MEYLTKIIEEASAKLGAKKALADYLGMSPVDLSQVLAGKRGLPDFAQDKLEKLMNLEGGTLRAPSAIITEKKPERVAYWKKKLTELERLAACIILGSVTTVVTPTPSEAAQLSQVSDFTVYIMSNNNAKDLSGSSGDAHGPLRVSGSRNQASLGRI